MKHFIKTLFNNRIIMQITSKKFQSLKNIFDKSFLKNMVHTWNIGTNPSQIHCSQLLTSYTNEQLLFKKKKVLLKK